MARIFFAVEENGRLAYQDDDELLDLPLPKLAGRHQQSNAAAAIKALKAAGFDLSEHVHQRMACSMSPGPGGWSGSRMGGLIESAMDGVEFWIDGGHNPGAGQVIAEAMANLNDRESRPLFLITGMINTKDPVGYFEAFAGMARHVFTVPVPDSDARLDPDFLADTADEAGLTAEPAESVEAAIAAICTQLERARTAAADPDRRFALSSR
jgi:dihydrofolate synthase/folylpolyglutamate synthase